MKISLRSRFILISVTIASLSLLLFTSVIYDRAINYKHRQEADTFRVIAEQFFYLSVEKQSKKNITATLAKNINLKNQPADYFAILDNERNATSVFKKNTSQADVFNNIIPFIKEKDNLIEGEIKHKGILYYWILRVLPSYTDKNNALLLVYPLSSSVVTEVLEFFGLPFYISGFLLIWMMVWASIILSSLVSKLQKQKQILTNQAADIEKARDDAMQANLAKSHFLANMSHEIRTPLTSIIGFAESSLDIEQSMQERLKANKIIIKSGKHLMHIINEILDLSKIEAGKIEIERIDFPLIDVLEDINQLVSNMAEEKGLTFKINYVFPLPEKICSDQLRLKQVLLNLCNNAIKFTEKGSVVLNVAYLDEMSSLKFEVIDTGIGMTEEQKDKIFNPFEQADSSTSRKFGGTGLGLTLSKQLLEMLDGTLTVTSRLNKGSKFIVKLKITGVDNTNFIYEDKSNVSEDNSRQINTNVPVLQGKILVAEDNEDIQALVKLLLKRTGVEADIVENGKLAVELARSADYDLVLMDIQMPVMDGKSAMAALKDQNCLVPVIAMTANAMKSDQDEYKKYGFSGFIGKPIDRNDLFSVLTQYLKPVQSMGSDKVLLTSNLLHDDPELIDLIDKFIKRLPDMQKTINTAYTENKKEELSGLIHQMKGVGGNYGYPTLTELCSKMEFQITGNHMDNVTALLADFNHMVEEIISGYDENHKIASKG